MLMIVVSDHQTASQADSYVLGMEEAMVDADVPLLRLRGLPSEMEYAYSSLTLEEDGSSMGLAILLVSVEKYVVSIFAGGAAEPSSNDLVSIVVEIVDRANSSHATLFDLLPNEDDLPYRMSVSVERTTESSNNAGTRRSGNTSNGITRTPRTGSTSSSRNTTSGESSGTITRTPRTGSANTSSGSSGTQTGSLRVVDITTKDAGIGDGTIYVYIELENASSKDYGYVQVDLICRDSSDRVVATGIANELGLPAGGSTVLTGIIMSAPDCVKVQAKVNPLSD